MLITTEFCQRCVWTAFQGIQHFPHSQYKELLILATTSFPSFVTTLKAIAIGCKMNTIELYLPIHHTATKITIFLQLLQLLLLAVNPSLAVPPLCLKPHPDNTCEVQFLVGRRYYYDSEAMDCLGFFHWGCPGKNSFRTKTSCLEMCASDNTSSTTPTPTPSPTSMPEPVSATQLPSITLEEICRQRPKSYLCTGSYMINRWFYNWETKQCEQYLSLNCRTNGNSFSTMERCLSFCGRFSTLSTTTTLHGPQVSPTQTQLPPSLPALPTATPAAQFPPDPIDDNVTIIIYNPVMTLSPMPTSPYPLPDLTVPQVSSSSPSSPAGNMILIVPFLLAVVRLR